MKQTPEEIIIQEKMQPGVISQNGFLGKDDRHVHLIIEEDLQTIQRLGKTNREIAERMQFFMTKAQQTIDGFVELESKYSVEYETVRGKILCPFSHTGAYAKGIVTFENKVEKITIHWTPLSVHLIAEHGFFAGKGSSFRLDPDVLISAIF